MLPSAAITSGIDPLLEWFNTNTAIGIQEGFFLGPFVDIHINDLGNHFGHLVPCKRGPQDLANGSLMMGIATETDLIELFAFLVNAQHANVSNVVVATGIHAAGDVEVDGAEVVQVIQIIKATLDSLSNGNRFGVGQGAEIAARAADDVGQGVQVGSGKAQRYEALPEFEQLILANIGQNHILLVCRAGLTKAELVCQVGNLLKLIIGHVTRRGPGFFQGQGDTGIAGLLVLADVVSQPLVEFAVLKSLLTQQGSGVLQCLVVRLGEIALEFADRFRGQPSRGVFDVCPFSFDFLGETFRGQCLYQNLDACLELVVAPAVTVIDPQDRLQVSQKVEFRQEFPNDWPHHGRAAQAATDVYAEAQLTLIIPDQLQADVVHLNGRPVCLLGGIYRHLEFAGQESKLRVEGRPLPDNLAVRARVGDFVGLNTGELVCGGVTDAVTAGLVGMHFHFGQFGQDIRNVFQVWPVQLDVGTGCKMRITLIVITGDAGQAADLV